MIGTFDILYRKARCCWTCSKAMTGKFLAKIPADSMAVDRVQYQYQCVTESSLHLTRDSHRRKPTSFLSLKSGHDTERASLGRFTYCMLADHSFLGCKILDSLSMIERAFRSCAPENSDETLHARL